MSSCINLINLLRKWVFMYQVMASIKIRKVETEKVLWLESTLGNFTLQTNEGKTTIKTKYFITINFELEKNEENDFLPSYNGMSNKMNS